MKFDHFSFHPASIQTQIQQKQRTSKSFCAHAASYLSNCIISNAIVHIASHKACRTYIKRKKRKQRYTFSLYKLFVLYMKFQYQCNTSAGSCTYHFICLVVQHMSIHIRYKFCNTRDAILPHRETRHSVVLFHSHETNIDFVVFLSTFTFTYTLAVLSSIVILTLKRN